MQLRPTDKFKLNWSNILEVFETNKIVPDEKYIQNDYEFIVKRKVDDSLLMHFISMSNHSEFARTSCTAQGMLNAFEVCKCEVSPHLFSLSYRGSFLASALLFRPLPSRILWVREREGRERAYSTYLSSDDSFIEKMKSIASSSVFRPLVQRLAINSSISSHQKSQPMNCSLCPTADMQRARMRLGDGLGTTLIVLFCLLMMITGQGRSSFA